MLPVTKAAAFLGGFVAAEGTFTNANGTRFRFAVALGAQDVGSCVALQAFLGVGRVYRYPRRRSHYDDEVVYTVMKMSDLVTVIVPFMDAHLPESFKRMQYRDWRAALMRHWEVGMKRRRPCEIQGCERPQRAKRLCRKHYYEVFGR